MWNLNAWVLEGKGDGDALFSLFTRTRAIRRSIIEAGQESAAPNFGRDKT